MPIAPIDRAEAHYTAGERFKKAGLLERAAQSYRRALRISPTLTAAHIELGVCLRFMEKLEEARESFEKALGLAPENIDAHFGLANVFRAQGLFESASTEYREVLQLEPDHSEARYFLHVVTPGETPTSIPPSLVTDLFDAYAPEYEDHVVRRLGYRGPRMLRKAIEPLLGSDTSLETVIDLGCGTGLCGTAFRNLADWLIGVDLSSRSIDIARGKGVYDELRVEDLLVTLRAANRTFDLILAADVFVYFGELEQVLSACAKALREGGRCAFTAEAADDATDFMLLPEGRFVHGKQYLEAVALEAGMCVERCSTDPLRTEYGRPIYCHVCVLR